MRTILSLVFCTFLLNIGFAQSEDAIRKGFKKYQDFLKAGEYEKSMDLVYPKLFDLVPKSTLLDAIKSTFNDPNLEIEMGDGKILEIGKAQKVEGEYFSFISYESVIKMKANASGEAEQEAINVQLKANFEENFGANNVSYDEETGFFTIKVKEQSLAISPNGKDSWKFLTLQKNQLMLMEQILPAEILEQVK